MKNNRAKKLKVIQELVESIQHRKSRHDDACRDVCWDEKERKKILREVAKIDKEIQANIAKAKEIFAPSLDSFESAEICVLLYVYSSAFSSSISRRIDSRELDVILRGDTSQLPLILDALQPEGKLHEHILMRDMRRGSGFDMEARSFALLHKFLMSE